MGESRAAPVSCSGVDGGNSLQEDVQFKVLHRFYPVYSLIKPLRACLYGCEVTRLSIRVLNRFLIRR